MFAPDKAVSDNATNAIPANKTVFNSATNAVAVNVAVPDIPR
ncbi:hypothetical protein [Corynebacterium auriscanis]|nr:hypothetical protein [Corynebacterium auriscanis]